MRIVTVVSHGDRFGIQAPLNYDFVQRSKKEFDGEWSKEHSAWMYPVAKKAQVLEAAKFYFGDDGTNTDVCCLLLVVTPEIVRNATDIRVVGRPLLRTTEEGYEFHEGVTLVRGGFTLFSSGSTRGSQRKRLGAMTGVTVLRVESMSWPMASRWIRSNPELYLSEDRAGKDTAEMFHERVKLLDAAETLAKRLQERAAANKL